MFFYVDILVDCFLDLSFEGLDKYGLEWLDLFLFFYCLFEIYLNIMDFF